GRGRRPGSPAPESPRSRRRPGALDDRGRAPAPVARPRATRGGVPHPLAQPQQVFGVPRRPVLDRLASPWRSSARDPRYGRSAARSVSRSCSTSSSPGPVSAACRGRKPRSGRWWVSVGSGRVIFFVLHVLVRRVVGLVVGGSTAAALEVE